MEKKAVVVPRPLVVTWLCILLFAAGIINIIYSFTGAFAGYGVLYSAANVLLIIIFFAALSGIWAMEKWGVTLFSVLLGLKFGLDLFVKAFHWWELTLLIILVVFWIHRKKMT
jgi:hypothetical protein